MSSDDKYPTEEEKRQGQHGRRSHHDVPAHLQRMQGLSTRDGGWSREASKEDISLVRRYPVWPNKGSIVNGRRLTLLTKSAVYDIDEEVRVIHVVEVIESGHNVYVMGPKKVYGEYLDGTLVTAPSPDWEDPLVPPFYDGAVLPSPAVDYNYEITSYTFAKPERHQIYWELGSLRSNTITIDIVDSAN